jgi:hypothetical protein
MPEYDNTNRGVLFKGKKQQDSHPDYEGSINVGGTEYWLNAWLKTSSNGNKFMSLSVKPKQQQGKQQPDKPKLPGNMQEMDDDCPFANPYKGRLSYVV